MQAGSRDVHSIIRPCRHVLHCYVYIYICWADVSWSVPSFKSAEGLRKAEKIRATVSSVMLSQVLRLQAIGMWPDDFKQEVRVAKVVVEVGQLSTCRSSEATALCNYVLP